jgi:hypothetical protein
MATWLGSQRPFPYQVMMSPLRIALFVSLGVNLFIVGWWVGDIWRRPPPMEPRPFNIGMMAQDRLDSATMDAIGPLLQSFDEVVRSGFAARDKVFADLRVAVAADPYDAQRVDALLASLVDQRVATENAQWRLVGETLAKLSPDQRDALADIIFLRPPGPPQGPFPGPGGPGGPPPPPRP